MKKPLADRFVPKILANMFVPEVGLIQVVLLTDLEDGKEFKFELDGIRIDNPEVRTGSSFWIKGNTKDEQEQ